MNSTGQKLNIEFSMRAFLTGLLIVALFYVLLFAFITLRKQATFSMLEERLASQTVLIEGADDYAAPLKEPENPESPEHSETELMPSDMQRPENVEIVIGGSEQELEHSVKAQAAALREAPIEGFYEETRFGKLPIAKDKMQTPFRAYKKPFLLNAAQPYIAIAVNDFGMSQDLSEQILETLPSEVSVILSPYSLQPNGWLKKARAKGHEVWIELPVETADFPNSDPGAKGLLSRVSLRYNQERLHWILGRAAGYAGIAAYSDKSLDAAAPMFTTLSEDMFNRGIGYFELNSKENGFIRNFAKDKKVPMVQSSAALEYIQPSSSAVKNIMTRIELSGGAVVTLNPSESNIGALKLWIQSLKKSGVMLVPVSAVATLNQGELE